MVFNTMQINHKGYSKGYVCFNTKGLSENDISAINTTYSSMSALEEYIDVELKAEEIMNLKLLIFYIKNVHPNVMADAIPMLINKLIKGEL